MQILHSKEIVKIYKDVLHWTIRQITALGIKPQLLLIPSTERREDTDFYFQHIKKTCQAFEIEVTALSHEESQEIIVHQTQNPQSTEASQRAREFLHKFWAGQFHGIIFGQPTLALRDILTRSSTEQTSDIQRARGFEQIRKQTDIESQLPQNIGELVLEGIPRPQAFTERRPADSPLAEKIEAFFTSHRHYLTDTPDKAYATRILEEIGALSPADRTNLEERPRYRYLHRGRFSGSDCIIPPTVLSVLEIFRFYKIDLSGKNVCIIGRSTIVGKPLAYILSSWDATVTLCHSKTKSLSEYTRRADIVISAIGRAHFISGSWIQRGAILIDIGTTVKNGKVYGDIDFESAKERASGITPVPGGIGPLTNLMLIKNLLQSCQKIQEYKN